LTKLTQSLIIEGKIKKKVKVMRRIHNQKGFTLIEILVVIGILAILLAIVLIAINPQQQFRQANNTQRRSDVNAVLNAVTSYAAQHKGQLPAGITSSPLTISSGGAVSDVDLCTALVPTYIADLPLDPTDGTEMPAASICTDASADYDTGYTIKSAAGNRVTVAAPSAEDENGSPVTISVTR
jgi:type IV pilus assembly protein PilA